MTYGMMTCEMNNLQNAFSQTDVILSSFSKSDISVK